MIAVHRSALVVGAGWPQLLSPQICKAHLVYSALELCTVLNDAIFLSGCLSVSTGIAKSLPVVNFDDTFLKRAHALIFRYN